MIISVKSRSNLDGLYHIDGSLEKKAWQFMLV